MGSILMFDDVTVSLLPAGYDAYAAYVDGAFKNDAAVKAKFPKVNVVTIAVRPADDADALDVEPGDATISQVDDWFKRQVARKVWRPAIYTSVSNVDTPRDDKANGIARLAYRLWSAHYGAGEQVAARHVQGDHRGVRRHPVH